MKCDKINADRLKILNVPGRESGKTEGRTGFTAGYVDEEVRSELRKDGVIMEKERYVAYVGTYTHGSSIGIHLYDVDVEEGTLTERKVVPVNNSSYVVKSKNGKYLYSIADEGVAVFAIKPEIWSISTRWISTA